ncbi:hypothetical protein N7535_009119 [Penicillium sp. DV-2018c]|nr:hypothetical protein N7535_009119 [Penicillium sp. DV-2018c]
MPVDKISVSGDPRIEYKTATLNGRNYSYILSQPQSGQYKATVILIHGFPDLSMGWRYQIPLFVDMGLRVVAPDCLGYGRTLVSHLFTVCVPYAAPTKKDVSLEDMVRTVTPHFGYQLQLKSGDLEKVIRSKEEISQFLLALYGGRTEKGAFGFDVSKGVDVDKIGALKISRLLSEEELDFYSNEFARSGVHGPLNWYRTRKVNYQDELEILDRPQIGVPTLFIQALRDQALPAHLGKSMAKHVPRLTLKQVDTAHWALWEKPDEVNDILATWLKDQVFAEGRAGKL